MAVEKAPYINYSEITSYQSDVATGSEIPLFIVKTGNTVNASNINQSSVIRFVSYGKFKEHFSITEDEESYNALNNSLKEVNEIVRDFFFENSMYGDNGSYGLSVPYIYVVDVGDSPTIEHYLNALTMSEIKRNSTVIVFPNTEDLEFMDRVRMQLAEETKSGLLRIAYFGVSGEGNLSDKFVKGNILRPQTEVSGITEVIEVYKNESDSKFYEESTYDTEVTPKQTAIYLNKTQTSSVDAYIYNGSAYTSINASIVKDELIYESDNDYKFIIPSTKTIIGGGLDETFNQYCERNAQISRKINSSRVAIVEKEHMGKTIARICSTPYYIEPGYLPYLSVRSGVFKQRSIEERDTLFGTGLIFSEDDYTLSTVTPRICLATSTSWGVEDHDMRVTDALIHARRNVDYHIRRIMNIVAPQLKRNETSVTLRHVKNQIDTYLNDELSKGTIMEYVFDVRESSYNPYTLLITGKITPVNSTLGIEFENTVGSPYAIASDYV